MATASPSPLPALRRKAFHSEVWEKADALFFFKGRLKFFHVDGTPGGPANAPGVLIAYRAENVAALKVATAHLKGFFVELRSGCCLRNHRQRNLFRYLLGRGSWIRTNDLQYPKLPRYQAALYPDYLGNDVDTRLNRCQQGAATTSMAVKQRMRHAVAGRDPVFLRRACDHLQHAFRQP